MHLASVLAVALLAVPAAADDAVRGVVLRTNGWSVLETEASKCAGMERAWLWSSTAAPQRIDDAKKLTTACESKTVAALLMPPAGTLRIDLPPRASRKKIDVLAAPAAMWEEVPEPLLPRVSTSAEPVVLRHDGGGVWRIRAVGTGEGSGWMDVPKSQRRALLAPSPAESRKLSILGADGKPAADASVEIIRQRGGDAPVVISRYISDRRGIVEIAALPDGAPFDVVIRHRDYAVAAFSASAAEFPITQQLEPGSTLRGVFAIDETTPVAGVSVAVEGWASLQLAHLFEQKTRSADDGTFALANLRPQKVALTARKKGFITHTAIIDVRSETVDLGRIRLRRGVTVTLTVVDDRDQPVEGAAVDAEGGPRTSDKDGRLVLDDVAADQPRRITARAPRHIRTTATIAPPFDAPRVRLPRGFVVKGRLVAADRTVVTPASIRIETGSSFRTEPVEDGSFEITLAPATDAKLAFSSATTAEITVSVEGGEAGVVHDLGDVVAPPGLTIAGRVLSAEGTPVANARVWLPKPSPRGPLAAWMTGDLASAATGADGRFTLSGLTAAPLLLRIDAEGFARGYRSVQLEASTPMTDVGDLTLPRGIPVRVRTRAAESTVSVDLRGEGLDLDKVTAGVRDGVALLARIPPGESIVSVVRERRTVCQKKVTVPAEGELTVECNPTVTKVRGTVQIGDNPASGGRLSWMAAGKAAVAAAIMERVSPGGLRQQQVWGAQEPAVLVDVGSDGRFETDELRAGEWRVSFIGAGTGVEQRITIPDQEDFQTTLRFADTSISGVVVSAEGAPVPRVVVQIQTANVVGMTGEDGSFLFSGVAPGEHELRARARDGRLAAERVRVESGRPTAGLRLVLRPAEADAITITAMSEGSQPAAGAFVFVVLEGEGMRVLTADFNGRAVLRLDATSRASRFRLAAFHSGVWGLGGWVSRAAAGSPTIAIDGRSSLVLTSERRSGPLEIVRSDGWHLSDLMRRIGAPPALTTAAPLTIHGLPAGRYTLSIPGAAIEAQLPEGKMRDVRID